MAALKDYFSDWGLEGISISGETSYTVETCTGTLVYEVPDDFCPPGDLVSTREELAHYCTKGTVTSRGTGAGPYSCFYYGGKIVCDGKIDPNKQVPECPKIASYSDDDYFSVCSHEQTSSYSAEKKKCDLSSQTFSCFDRSAKQWCRGTVIKPTHLINVLCQIF